MKGLSFSGGFIVIVLCTIGCLVLSAAQETTDSPDSESSSVVISEDKTEDTTEDMSSSEPVTTTVEATTTTPLDISEFTEPPPVDDSTESVKVLFTYEKEDLKKLIDIGLAYLEKHPSYVKEYPIKSETMHIQNQLDATRIIVDLCSKIDDHHPDIVVDFTERGIPSEAVKIVTKTLKLPTISSSYGRQREWMNLNGEQRKYLVHIKSPADVAIQVTRSISESLNVSNMAILHNDEYEMFYNYRDLLVDVPTRHKIMEIKSSTGIQEQLQRLQVAHFSTFVIAANLSQINNVLEEAMRLDENPKIQDAVPLLDKSHSWYTMSLEGGQPACKDCKDVSLVHLEPDWNPNSGVDWQKENLKGTLRERFIVDVLSNAIHTVGKMKSEGAWHKKERIPCANYEYIKYNNTEELDLDFVDKFSSISVLTSFPIIMNKGNDGDNLIELKLKMNRLQYTSTSGKQETPLGHWKAGENRSHSFDYSENQNLNFHKAKSIYRVVTVVQPPFVYKDKLCDPSNKTHHCYTGYAIDMIDELSRRLKFSYTIYDVDKYGFMNDTPPHEWDGMVRSLHYKEADIAIGAFSILPEREKVMEFTEPVYPLVGFQVLMRKIPLVTSLFKFLTVLENDVWMCILGAYFFTSILMWIFDRWSPYSFQNNKEKFEDDEEKREFSLKESLWFCITSLTPQGGGEAPKNLSGRLVAATWWLFGFIIIASYTANLAAFLTVSRLEAPIESLEDLSRQYRVQYAAIENSSAFFYYDRMAHVEHKFYEAWKDLSLNDTLSEFERSGLAVWEYPVSDKYTKFWQSMMDNHPPKNYSHALLRCKGADDPRNWVNRTTNRRMEEFAWIGESPEIQYEAMTHCMFRVVGKQFCMRPYAIGVQKGSPLKDDLNRVIKELEKERYLEYIRIKWWDKNKNKARCKKYDNLADGISIHNIGGVFIVLVIGFTMTFVSTVLELWWYHRKNDSMDLDDQRGTSEAPSREWSAAFGPVERTDFHAHYSRPPSKTEW